MEYNQRSIINNILWAFFLFLFFLLETYIICLHLVLQSFPDFDRNLKCTWITKVWPIPIGFIIVKSTQTVIWCLWFIWRHDKSENKLNIYILHLGIISLTKVYDVLTYLYYTRRHTYYFDDKIKTQFLFQDVLK